MVCEAALHLRAEGQYICLQRGKRGPGEDLLGHREEGPLGDCGSEVNLFFVSYSLHWH